MARFRNWSGISPPRRAASCAWPRSRASGARSFDASASSLSGQSGDLHELHQGLPQEGADRGGDPGQPPLRRRPRLDRDRRGHATCGVPRLSRRFYRIGSEVILGHDGLVDKLVGDEIIGLFFGGISGPRHAAAAIDAAIELVAGSGGRTRRRGPDPDRRRRPHGRGVRGLDGPDGSRRRLHRARRCRQHDGATGFQRGGRRDPGHRRGGRCRRLRHEWARAAEPGGPWPPRAHRCGRDQTIELDRRECRPASAVERALLSVALGRDASAGGASEGDGYSKVIESRIVWSSALRARTSMARWRADHERWPPVSRTMHRRSRRVKPVRSPASHE